MKRKGPIRVLIVDDSPLVRSILSHALAQETDIQVVGGAKDPYEARERIIEHRPLSKRKRWKVQETVVKATGV